MNPEYAELMAQAAHLYIEGRLEEALTTFDAAREVEITIQVDLWRARVMMDLKDGFHAVSLIEWMLKEHEGNILVRRLSVIIEFEIRAMQGELQGEPAPLPVV